jgi:hypothetical protein
MVVTDERVAALRALMIDDEQEYDRLTQWLERNNAWGGYSALFGPRTSTLE